MPLVAALIAVPLPFNSPVMVVESVMAGVVVDVATVPARPFADTTETLVTVPPDDGEVLVTVIEPEPLEMEIPVPAVKVDFASVLPVVLPINNCPSVCK